MALTDFNARLRAAAVRRGLKALKLKANGRTWAEVGAIMGISRQRAQQLASRSGWSAPK